MRLSLQDRPADGAVPRHPARHLADGDAADVLTRVRDAAAALPGAPTGPALDALLCQKLRVAPLRFSTESRFPDGVSYPNHANLVMVDEQGFYLGSQNLYNAALTEYGYIVDDAAATAELRAAYWAHLSPLSSLNAVSGSEAASCALRP
jgi:hypothetical protein